MYEHLFHSRSGGYAAARPRYPEPLYAYLASQCAHHDAAWDCACGSGQATVDLARHFLRVFATDASENQIASAMQRGNIEYSVRASESADFPDESFDLVCAAQSLHWFDLDRFWLEARRVMRDDGVFAAWGYSWFHMDGDIDTLVKTRILEVIAPFWSPRNALLWEGYEGIRFPFGRLQTPAFEMIQAWDLEELFSYIGTWSAVRLCIERRGDGFMIAATESVKKIWGDPGEKRRVRMDFHLLAGRK